MSSTPSQVKRPVETAPAERPNLATVAVPKLKRNKLQNTEEDAEEEAIVADWRRPPLLPFSSDTTYVAMQQIEADYYVSDFAANPVALPAIKLSAKPAPTDCADPAAVFEDGVPATSAGPMRPDHVHQVSKVMEEAIAESRKQRRAVIRLFGVTEHGNSVAMHVHNFLPYFYVPAWRGLTVASLQEFKDALNQRVLTDSRERGITSAILGVEVVRKKSIWGFHRENSDFIKIILALPTLVPSAVRLLGQGVPIGNGQTQAFTTYESNVSSDKTFVLRYMIDISTAGGSWVEAPGRAYAVRGAENTKLTTCQLEVDIDARHIIAHESAGRWLKMAPLRVLSYDIECAGRRGFFPTPDQDSVIQIASVVALSENLNKPLHKCVHTLNTCASIAGAEIVSRMTEPEMLQAWSDHFRDVDPDVITGYNMVNFDMPYLIDRAKTLKLGARFAQFTRIKDLESTVRNTTFSSGALGKQENKETNMEGRIQFDVLVALRREYNLRSYSLNAVSAEFLKQQKEDVHHSIITDLQNGTDETRKRLAVYCLKDAVLPLRLMQKLMFLVNYVEMARVTGVPLMYLLTRGQSIKVISQILRKAKQHDLIVPVVKKGGNDDNYEGATVLDPKQGYYSTPIATLDFASLYPSIMMAHNLCYTTMVSSADAAKMPAGDAHRTPNGDWFVNQKVARGVLPEILEELLSARKAARKEMASAKDPFTKAVLNGRQLALKISANSVYGFTGAQVGQLPCLAISSSVTGYGREMIEHTKNTVEKIYTKANGYEHDAVVIYGDTDSVMVKFGTEDIKEAMRLGVEAAGLVSKEFISPIRLEFEKVYWPYLLLNRKRYAGLYWTNPNKWDKIDAKGIETVRRDNCGLVKKLFSECLDMILVRRSPDLAVAHVKRVISDLLCNKMDLSLLVISKSLGKGASADDYDAKQAHVELAERMRKRDPASAPAVGDRVPFVIIKAAKGAPNYEKSEDPIWVLENDLPIDTDYYIENQLKKPLLRLFEPILGEKAASDLFSGDHTLKVKVTTGAANGGGIMQFAKKTETCIGCRCSLPTGRRSLCVKCEPRRAEFYISRLEAHQDNEEVFAKLWSQCQRCQGSVHQEVLCASRDCPIFYRRKKVQLDLAETTGILERFALG